MAQKLKARDYGFDNIKLMLIILVVFGHIIEGISVRGYLGVVRSVIYSFHMPLFIFISGYFSKFSSSKKENAFFEYLVPFFVFNTIYSICISHTIRINIFLPIYVFWYLFNLFIWTAIIDYLDKFRPLLIVSVLLGLYVGVFAEFDRFFSLSRIICFFPYFVLGYKFSESQIKRLRSVTKLLPIVCLGICFYLTVMMNYHGVIPVKMYEMLQSYKSTDVGNFDGILQRMLIYSVAFVVVLSIVTIMPNKKFFFTKYGERTVCIYIFSSFVIQIMFYLCDKYNFTFDGLGTVKILEVSAAICVLITALTGNKLVFIVYRAFINSIKKLFKSDGKEIKLKRKQL